ncbi:MAG: hypothetical protein JO339_09000 [Alphaproteobacteria bacterium]|nr:hypothetical protein [Alphaproteobacteria bacterium]
MTLLLPLPAAYAGDVDTQFIFGFAQGSDVGELGDREVEFQNNGAFGKADGTYTALGSELRGEFTPFQNLRLEAGALFTYYAIQGVSGLDNQDAFRFAGVAVQGRYRVLDRRSAPFGLTVGVEPHWLRVDDTSGQAVTNWGGPIVVAVDKELVEDRVFAAFNVLYDPEWSHLPASNSWQQQSTLGLFAAVTAQASEGLFLGAEAYYLRSYDGAALNSFSGDGLFLGPTAYWRASQHLAISAAWSVQVAGGAVGVVGGLNLQTLTNHQVLLRLEYTF